MDFFKKIFGLESNLEPPNFNQRGSQQPLNEYDNRHSFPGTPSHGNQELDPFQDFYNNSREGFDMFSNPLEMHRYFEQQMDHMLKAFGFSSNGMPSFGGFFSQHDMPQIEDDQGNPFYNPQQEPNNARDHFLKRGYKHPESYPVDKDVDKEFKKGDLGTIMARQNSETQTPYQQQPRSSVFGQGVSIKTSINADGSLETFKTIRSSDGSEETQITHKLGDKEYTVIKKRDPNGKEEIIENLVNLDETEKHNFFAPKPNLPSLESNARSDFWDKFFK